MYKGTNVSQFMHTRTQKFPKIYIHIYICLINVRPFSLTYLPKTKKDLSIHLHQRVKHHFSLYTVRRPLSFPATYPVCRLTTLTSSEQRTSINCILHAWNYTLHTCICMCEHVCVRMSESVAAWYASKDNYTLSL